MKVFILFFGLISWCCLLPADAQLNEDNRTASDKIVIVYLSLTNNTKAVAEIIHSKSSKFCHYVDKDDLVSSRHSHLLSAWLTAVDVPNELIIVKDAPHYGAIFDTDEVRNKVIHFLKKHLN